MGAEGTLKRFKVYETNQLTKVYNVWAATAENALEKVCNRDSVLEPEHIKITPPVDYSVERGVDWRPSSKTMEGRKEECDDGDEGIEDDFNYPVP